MQYNGFYAMCNDASTLVVASEAVELSSIYFNDVRQYDYSCESKTYEEVSAFSTDDNGENQIVGVKFGGQCCDRLFLLLRNAFNSLPTYSVNVHDRRSERQLSQKGILSASACCNGDRGLFSDENLVAKVENAVEPVEPLDWKPNVSLYADPVDGDLFVVVLAHGKQNQTTSSESYPRKPIGGAFNMRFWRQPGGRGDTWLYRDATQAEMEKFPGSRCYDTQRFSNLIFDHECQTLCFPLAQRMYPFNEDISDTHFVSYNSGTFYLHQRQHLVGLNHSVWFRHPGTATYILLPELDINSVALDLSAKCGATEVEVITTENDFEYDPNINGFILTVRDPNERPDIITKRYTVPVRLSFNVVCFKKQ